MSSSKTGIAIAGSIIADVVKNIDIYPEPGMLAYISDVEKAVGGCVPNTAIDIAKIDSSLPISVYGRTGKDENGEFIISELSKNGIDVSGIIRSETAPTSFCDVMSMPTGERTFFNKKGANAEFSPEDIDFDNLSCKIFHIGYIHLLDSFDKEGVMPAFLNKLQNKGIKTSIDVVSDSTADYGKIIKPILKYTDYAIMNEIESCSIFSLNPYKNNKLDNAVIKEAMYMMAECGVKEKVIVHSKEISFILDVKSNILNKVNSLKIPNELIKGSVGAGDAFCAGCLYGLYNNFSDEKILSFASATAACSLFAANSVDGMRNKSEISKLSEKYGRIL